MKQVYHLVEFSKLCMKSLAYARCLLGRSLWLMNKNLLKKQLFLFIWIHWWHDQCVTVSMIGILMRSQKVGWWNMGVLSATQLSHSSECRTWVLRKVVPANKNTLCKLLADNANEYFEKMLCIHFYSKTLYNVFITWQNIYFWATLVIVLHYRHMYMYIFLKIQPTTIISIAFVPSLV